MNRSTIGIAGAGLAGLTTAIGLAQAGLPVRIADAASDSGWERKDTWDAVENWTTETDFADVIEGWNIARDFELRPIRSFEVFIPSGESYTITTPRPILYLVKRGCQPGALEHTLKKQALDRGVTIRYQLRCTPQDVDVWAVGAQHRGQFLGIGLRFQTHSPDTVKLLISAGHAPKAYAYLFIYDGQGVLSVILTRGFANARIYLRRSLEFFRQVSPFDMENEQMTSGFGGRRGEFWQDSASPLRVGEAAGFQDYLWGFGIRYALLSGYLASQSITLGTDYYEAIHNQIRPLVHTSMANRAAYNRAGDGVYRLLIDWFSKSPRLIELLRGRYRAAIPKPLLGLLR